MSDQIKHECGIALVRLLQPLEYYQGKYGSSIYGLNKLHLLMEKQHNRGQDGAGVAGASSLNEAENDPMPRPLPVPLERDGTVKGAVVVVHGSHGVSETPHAKQGLEKRPAEDKEVGVGPT